MLALVLEDLPATDPKHPPQPGQGGMQAERWGTVGGINENGIFDYSLFQSLAEAIR